MELGKLETCKTIALLMIAIPFLIVALAFLPIGLILDWYYSKKLHELERRKGRYFDADKQEKWR